MTVPNFKQITDSHLRNKYVQNTNQSGYNVQIVLSVIEVAKLRGLYQQKAQLQCSTLATVAKLLTLLMEKGCTTCEFLHKYHYFLSYRKGKTTRRSRNLLKRVKWEYVYICLNMCVCFPVT